MAQTEGQRRATDAVSAEMTRRGWNAMDLAREAGVDPGTLYDFFAYKRWFRTATQNKVETALTMAPGTMRAMSLGIHPPTASPQVTDDRLTLEEKRSNPVGAGVDPALMSELADATPQEVEAVKAVLRAIRSGGT